MWVGLMKEGKWFLPQCGSQFVLITECHVSVNLVTVILDLMQCGMQTVVINASPMVFLFTAA